ncbi:MAG: efflux RND transporter periplasmic adaptor subunit [Myxococcales bacterium]|nr:efflux RND transporter periplasmic adaptor subunit [Myxococcales bacterium]
MRSHTRQLVVLAVVVSACHHQAPATPPPPPVRVATLQTRALEQTREWLATLDGATNAEIRPRVSGYIRSVDYQEGTVVAAGTLLFTLDDRPFVAAQEKARGDLENAQAQLGKSRADVARYQPLAAEHAIPREQLENAAAAARAASATVAAMRGSLQEAALNLEWTRVRSPIAGVSGIARTRVGTLVDSNQVLTVVSTLDPIRASYNISEQEYLQFAEIINHVNEPEYANTRWLELVLINGRLHPYNARRVIVNREINPQTGTLLLQALFPNPGNILRPGLFAKVRLHLQREAPTVVVPEIAVQQLQGQSRVAVVDATNHVEIRTVRLGRIVDHAYLVESGLRAGERVVVEGMQNVQPGIEVQVQAAAPRADDGGT